ncbi:site-specific integrase [Jiella pacifica]|uniref:Tyrosine-type recombinase/integrase n=1 Tax=Jiella pacifica TaxID=2696469 RepID=A0A6N9T7R8_9HYPH|nr:site-specific integrase [Jiella pacifica]NDW07457.1 tyrosine-type recombinase/integrase [Jiella pacifica]
MSVRKRTWSNGKGDVRTGWQYDFCDLNGKRQRKQFRTKREADAFRVKIEGQLAGGSFRGESQTTTVRDLALTYLAHAEGRSIRGERFTRGHLLTVTGHIWNYICPDAEHRVKRKVKTQVRLFEDGVGHLKLAHLTTRAIGDLRDRLRNVGVGVITTRKILSTLSAMLAFAVSKDLVAFNPATGIRVIGRRDEGAKKIVPPSKEAMRAIIAVADPDFRVQIIFAAASAVRAGEHHALRWRHIDFEAGEVAIETRVDVWGEEDTTKTTAGVRTVPLASSVLTMLKEWRLRSRFGRDDDLVFPNRRGGYLGHGSMVKRKFYPLFRKLEKLHQTAPSEHAPAPKRFNWHALRHFGISTWIEADLKPKTIQTFAGHSSLQVTMDCPLNLLSMLFLGRRTEPWDRHHQGSPQGRVMRPPRLRIIA